MNLTPAFSIHLTWPGSNRESYLVYGHIHSNKDARYWSLLKSMDRALNAGVEVNGYQPVTLEELMRNNTIFRC